MTLSLANTECPQLVCVWGERTQVACRGPLHLFCNQWALLSKLCCLLRYRIRSWELLAGRLWPSRTRTKEFHIFHVRDGI
jgi:hypothetical protein